MFRANRPKGRWFNHHLLVTLGKLTGNDPFVGVSPQKVVNKVLTLAGIDPDNPPWMVETRGDSPQRIVGFTFRNLRPQYRKIGFLTVKMPDGSWALSVQGAEKAAALQSAKLPKWKGKTAVEVLQAAHANKGNPKFKRKTTIEVVTPHRLPGEGNFTSRWITEQGKEWRDGLCRYLAARFAVSRESQLIEDHAHKFIADFIERDSLLKHPTLRAKIEEGKKVSWSQIYVYGRNNTNSQIRDNARRPLHRIMQRARTKKERDKEALTKNNWAQCLSIKSPLRLTEADDWTGALESLPDETSVEAIEEKIAFEEGFSAFHRALKRRAPSQADEYVTLLEDRFVKEMTVRECAEKRGITRNQAASMLRTARSIVIREYDRGRLRHELGHG